MTLVPSGPCPRCVAPDPAGLAATADALRAGGVVGIPTDTVYGLAALPSVNGATRGIFLAKGRPRSVTLPVLVADIEQVEGLVTAIPGPACRLMARWWPGALTVVLDRAPDVAADLGDDATSIGVRCPAHLVPRTLAARVGPIATTSANRHGAPPANRATEVIGLPGVALVVDGGLCDAPPSTVVDGRTPDLPILRVGAITEDALRRR